MFSNKYICLVQFQGSMINELTQTINTTLKDCLLYFGKRNSIHPLKMVGMGMVLPVSRPSGLVDIWAGWEDRMNLIG